MDDRLEQLADTLCLTGATRVERFGKQAADLTSLAPKWKDRQHIMVALRQHLQEAQQALDTEDEQKELTDLALITDAYRRSQVGRQLLRQRMAKFRQYAGSPSLADQPASHVKQAISRTALLADRLKTKKTAESQVPHVFVTGAPGAGIDAGGGGVKIGEDTQYRLSPEYARRLQDLSPRGERSAMHDWLDLHTEKVAFNPFIAAGKLGLRGAGIAYRGMKSGLGLTRAQNARRVMSAMRSAPNRRHYDRIVRSAKATGVKGPSLLNPLGWMTPLSTAESRFTQAGRARWLAQQAAGNTRAWKRVAGGMAPRHARQAQQAITQSKVMAPRSVMGAPAQRMAIQDSLRRTDPNMIGYMAAYPSVFNPAKRAIGFGGGDAGGFDQEMPYAGYDEGMS